MTEKVRRLEYKTLSELDCPIFTEKKWEIQIISKYKGESPLRNHYSIKHAIEFSGNNTNQPETGPVK